MPWTPPETDQIVGAPTTGWKPPESDQEVGNYPHEVGAYLKGAAGNVPGNAVGIAGNVANLAGNLVSHPIDTAAGVVKGLPAALKGLAGEWGVPEAMHGRFSDAMDKVLGSVYNHPVDRALDVASVALPALKGVGALGEGAEAAGIAGKGAEIGKAGEMMTDASNALGRRELGFTKRLLNTGDKMDKANDATEWANKNGLMDVLDSPDIRLEKTNALKDKAWGTMSDTYQNPALAGKNLNAQRLVDSLEEMRPRNAEGKVLRGGDWDALNGEIDKKIETIQSFRKNTPNGTGYIPQQSDIPWQDAQNLKNTMKGATKWELTQPSTINDLRKRLSGAFRGNMDTQLEEGIGKDNMAAYNGAKSDYGMAKNVQRALDNKISSKAGNRLGGLTDMIAGGAGYTHGGPLSAMAVVAGKKLIERYGLAAGSKVLSQMAGGKYAGVFGHMTTFGPAEMATLNMVAEKDPQFAQELTSQGNQ